ncbi:NAD-dependent epimerase/dehydratase family protein [Streptomyces sp. 24-1644]|uniref:NAD-dependent epimerase/dehydratase family protein n=1 Tax=Streptomyces sp. 24-1644 TaxID=3457315 RepID=UPI003FA7ED1C
MPRAARVPSLLARPEGSSGCMTTSANERLPRRRAVVTGGTGFPGSPLCERLLDGGVVVDRADNPSSAPFATGAHLVGSDGFRFVNCDVPEPTCTHALTGPVHGTPSCW